MSKFNPFDHPICFAVPLRRAPSAWVTHVPFGMFLIDMMRPSTIVELGTHFGVSYCSFCQAVSTLGLDSHTYAIDTWMGDEHNGFYGSTVLEDLQKHHDPRYGVFSQLIQSTFDDAVKHFEEGTIDLLHIDGYHTYEAVKHDFETWLPKLSSHAVVLFHDIEVRDKDFGVWKLWDELSALYPSFSFVHGHGLGLLAVGKKTAKALDILWKMRGSELTEFRNFFSRLGEAARTEQVAESLSLQVAEQEHSLQGLAEQLTQITSSYSWKITLPFREIRKWISNPLSQIRRYRRYLKGG